MALGRHLLGTVAGLCLAGGGFGAAGCSSSGKPQPRQTAAGLLSASPDALAEGRAVQLDGVVTLSDPETRLLVVEGASGGVAVSLAGRPERLNPGERIRVFGFTGYERFAPLVVKARIERLGMDTIRPARLRAPKALFEGRLDFRAVEFDCAVDEGLIADMTRFELAARLEGRPLRLIGTFRVAAPLRGWRTPRARVVGVPISSRSPAGEVDSVRVYVLSLRDLEARGDGGLREGAEEPTPSAPRGADRLESVRAIKELSNRQAALRRPVRLRAVVTGWDLTRLDFFVQDDEAAVYVSPAHRGEPAFGAGDSVEIEGYTQRGGYAPSLVATSIRRLGRGRWPEPIRPAVDRPPAAREENAWAEVRGVVQSVDRGDAGRADLRLRVGGSTVLVLVLDGAADLPPLVNREVTVRGIFGPAFTAGGLFGGVRVFCPDPRQIEIAAERPGDSLDGPARAIGDLREYDPAGLPRGAVKVAGQITHVALDGAAHLSDGTSGLRLTGPRLPSLHVGESVEVLGRLIPSLPDLAIEAVTVRPARRAVEVAPQTIRIDDARLFDGRLVRFDGYLLRRDTREGDRILVLETVRTPVEAVLESPAPFEGWDELRPNALLRLTGVLDVQWHHGELPPVPAAVRLLLRAPGDIAALRPAPWWTVGRAVTLAAATAGSLLLAMAWVATLHYRVRKQTEQIRVQARQRETLEARLQESRRLEAVGRLAGGVAHDFNNLLTIISGYCDLLLRDSADERGRSRLAQIRRAGERAAELTRQLLAFSRRQVLRPTRVEVAAAVAEMEPMLRRLIGEDIALEVSLPAEPLCALVDPGQLGQVLMNLAANARDAMPDGGRLGIEVAAADLDPDYAATPAGVEPGRYVCITVTDTGQGMDDETRTHVFEPFFTTKSPGKGTGLGLATVFGIVKQSGGHVWLYSEPGQGASFKVHLPRTDEETPASAEPAPGAPSSGTETVLVVEDLAEVRDLMVAALAERGYRVLSATDAEQAQALAREHGGQIGLLVTDVVLPGANGKVLAEKLSALHPGLRVLFTSGYAPDVIADQGVLDAGVDYLPKPFAPDELARRVRAALDRGHREGPGLGTEDGRKS